MSSSTITVGADSVRAFRAIKPNLALVAVENHGPGTLQVTYHPGDQSELDGDVEAGSFTSRLTDSLHLSSKSHKMPCVVTITVEHA